MKRKTPLRPRQGPQKARGRWDKGKPPSKATKARREARRRKRWALQFHSEEFVRFVQSLPCVSCGHTPSEAHHDPPRSCGGTWLDVSPLCHDCHTLGPESRHRAGRDTFWARVGLTREQANARTQMLWHRKP